jgi:hypothetical protein
MFVLRVITILTLQWPLASKMKNVAIDLSSRFTPLFMRLSDDSKLHPGKSFKLLDSTFVSQPAPKQSSSSGASWAILF